MVRLAGECAGKSRGAAGADEGGRQSWRWTGCLLLLVSACSSSPPPGSGGGGDDEGPPAATTFSKSYGGAGIDSPHAVRAAADGGIIMVGHAGARLNDAGGLQDGDLWISKLDANGNIEQQHRLGMSPSSEFGTAEFARVRATPDGGYVAVGTDGVIGIIVARFDASGAMLWSKNYESGPWLNYEFEGGTGRAIDFGRDVSPLPDGGFWVVADSIADLRDVQNIGFDGPNTRSDVFIDARSVVLLRLNAAGDVTHTRRLTEDAFGTYGRDSSIVHGWNFDQPIIRATADGGAVIARRKRFRLTPDEGGSSEEHTYTLVQRVFADGAVRWAQRLDDALFATELLESQQSGDVFLVAHERADSTLAPSGCARVVQFRSGGEVGWTEDYDCSSTIHSIYEHCIGPTTCTLLLGGAEQSEEGRQALIRRVWPPDGTLVDSVALASHPGIEAIAHLSRGEDIEPFHAIGRGPDGAYIVRLRRDTLGVLSSARIQTELEGPVLVEESADSRVRVFSPATQRVRRASFTGEVELDFPVSAPGRRTDRGLAVVELPGARFVVAGDSQSFSELADGVPRTEAWIASYAANRGEVEWQRRIPGAANGVASVRALVASSDGGVVLGGRLEGDVRLLKLSGAGEVVWQSPSVGDGRFTDGFIRLFRELHATSDGGFVSLVARGESPSLLDRAVVAKVTANGAVEWVRSYVLENPGSIYPIDDDDDGARDDGFVIASLGLTSADLVTAVKLDTRGDVLWVRGYRAAESRSIGEALGFPRIRQTSDGGFLLAARELGVLSALDEEGAQLQPFGETNVLLLKLNAAGAPEWLRIYGARHDEDLHDVDVMADGSLLVAGRSQSFGEQDAWLLKLGADGLVSNGGCNAHLGSMAAELLESRLIEARLIDLRSEAGPPVLAPPQQIPTLADTTALLASSTQIETARQCLGSANPPPTGTPIQQFTLTVNQVGSVSGPVISTPRGVACGTGLGEQFCTGEFPAGTRVTLTADIGGFRGWESTCDEGTGGASTVCVVTLTRDRSIDVVFGAPSEPPPPEPPPPEPPPPPTTATLSVQLESAPTDALVESMPAGIQCTTASGSDCSETYNIGAQVMLRASPLSQFSSWRGCDAVVDVTFCEVTLQADRVVTVVFTP